MLILSKLEALAGRNPRPYDEDDIIDIIEAQKLDFDYIIRKIEELQIAVKESLYAKFKNNKV